MKFTTIAIAYDDTDQMFDARDHLTEAVQDIGYTVVDVDNALVVLDDEGDAIRLAEILKEINIEYDVILVANFQIDEEEIGDFFVNRVVFG